MAVRSPSKRKVAGSIPAEALPFWFYSFLFVLIFFFIYLFVNSLITFVYFVSFFFVVYYFFLLYYYGDWSRGAVETRLPPKQKIVGSTPTGIVFYSASAYSLYVCCFFSSLVLCPLFFCFKSPYLLSSL